MNRRWLMLMLCFFVTFNVTHAKLLKLTIHRREPFADGMVFGRTGAYELLEGIATFGVDPNHKRNQMVIDLANAPRNKDGLVEMTSDVFILIPKDREKSNGAIFYDVNNRGNKLALRFFNDAPGSNNPKSKRHAGNGYLLRRGYTVVWCGWIGELLPGGHRMLMQAPIATNQGKPIRGIVRYEMVTDSPAKSLPLSRREGHGSYPPTKKGLETGRLTWRLSERGKRVPIPRGQWKLETIAPAKVEQGAQGTLSQIRMHVAGGFRPGAIYELVCESEGPIVQGLGFVAVRDLISFLRHDTSKENPCQVNGKSVINRAHGFGVSQSGRFLRHFTYEGFNVDEKDRLVFDGLIPHVAGGGLGFFNHRFAQPTRHNGQLEEHLYPADVFPFTYGELTDPYTKRKDGILNRLASENRDFLPKIMHTQSAAEYWHRSGSLVHTDPMGKRDVEIPEHVRIYAFGGTQHGPASWPPPKDIGDNHDNPGDYRPLLRGLLDRLDEWVKNDTTPPPSVYPTIQDKTLVYWDQKSTGFPALPGVRYPEVIQQPNWLWLGRFFQKNKIITVEPPQIRGSYRVLVPRSDKDGNDLGTLLVPEVAVPLATFTGWNLRQRTVGAEANLASLKGSWIPFPKTKKDREAMGDPRLSIVERYGNFETYAARFKKACDALVQKGYLLEEDAKRMQADLESRWKYVLEMK